MSVWTKIKLWAERKEREEYLNKHGHDRRCPHCNTWQGNCGGVRSYRDDGNSPDEWHAEMVCGKCGQASYWFCGSMVPVLVTEDFNPGNLSNDFLAGHGG